MRRALQGIKELLSHPFFAGLIAFVILLKVLTPLIRPTVCRDGWPSGSIGIRGACSHHGGVGANWSLLGVFLASAIGAIAVGWTLVEIARRKQVALYKQWQAQQAVANVHQNSALRKAPKGPACPLCGSSMRERTARRGRNAGTKFWGCGKYPRCHGTRPMAVESMQVDSD